MLDLRPLSDEDVPLVETWLHKAHVKKWYEIPHMGITIDDWMYEISERNEKFSWLTYLIAAWQAAPLGFANIIGARTAAARTLERCRSSAPMESTT